MAPSGAGVECSTERCACWSARCRKSIRWARSWVVSKWPGDLIPWTRIERPSGNREVSVGTSASRLRWLRLLQAAMDLPMDLGQHGRHLKSARRYSLRRWGPERTAQYMAAVRDTVRGPLLKPSSRKRPDLRPGLRMAISGQHCVFFVANPVPSSRPPRVARSDGPSAALDNSVKAHVGVRMQDPRTGNPTVTSGRNRAQVIGRLWPRRRSARNQCRRTWLRKRSDGPCCLAPRGNSTSRGQPSAATAPAAGLVVPAVSKVRFQRVQLR